LDNTEIREQLERILSSERFAQADRLSRFLSFVVERTLEGRPESVKEYVIATEALGRGAEYNPQIDSTVRADASRLRARLTEYYATEGRNDPVEIRIPKGSYVPEFSVRLTAGAPPTTTQNRKWVLVGLAALLVLGVLGAVLVRTVGRTAKQAGRIESVAVLRFVSLGESEAEKKLATSLSQRVAVKLGEAGFKVTGGTAAEQSQVRSLDLMETGRRLGVDAVLTASVQLTDGRVLVTSQLAGMADGFQLWAKVMDRPASDLLRREAEISEEITHSLAEQFRRSAAGAGRPRNPKAMELYLKAHETVAGNPWQTGWSEKEQRRFEEGIRLFEEAVREDSTLAAAWVELGEVQRRVAGFQPGVYKEMMVRARESVERALEIDPVSARGRWLRARIAMYSDLDLTAAEPDFARAIALNPYEGEALMEYADLLFLTGRDARAVFEVNRALEMDATQPQFHIALGLYDTYMMRNEECLQQAERALALNGQLPVAHWLKTRCLAELGQTRRAEEALRQGMQLAPGDRRIVSQAAYWHSKEGRAAEARALVESMRKSGQHGRNVEYTAALVAAAEGRKDEAFRYLERSFEMREASFVYLPIENRLRGLREDERFAGLVARIRGAKWRPKPRGQALRPPPGS
jgi:tetratricopeptide (TPR) repeat protein